MGLIIPAERLLPKFLKGGFITGWTGSDLGEGRRLKFVVFPLKALIVRENLAEGTSEEKEEVELEFGFKLIL